MNTQHLDAPPEAEFLRHLQASLIVGQAPWIRLKADIYRTCHGYTLSVDGTLSPAFTTDQQALLLKIDDMLDLILRAHERAMSGGALGTRDGP